MEALAFDVDEEDAVAVLLFDCGVDEEVDGF